MPTTPRQPLRQLQSVPDVQLDDSVHLLHELAGELLNSPIRHDPDIFATCEAIECAATLLRARQADTDSRQTAVELLRDAVALARSTVEATKYTVRSLSSW
jgi:hypothetical protein